MNKPVFAGVFLAAAFAAGCVIEAGPAPAGVPVAGPPPQPMAEVPSRAPAAQAIWVAGYWHWTGMQYTWIPGHWEIPPPGSLWRAPRYSLREGTYFYEAGSWTRK
jgi:hypothetical protein